MKTYFTAILLLIVLSSPVFAEFELTSKNLENAFEIPDSRSPNGSNAFFCINRGDTTAKFIGVMRITRRSLLAETQLFHHGSDKREYKQYLEVKWSPDSKLVAVHDSSRLHSQLHIYRIQKESFRQIKVPDLILVMLDTLPASIEAASSGQIPVNWTSDIELLVLVRIKDTRGNLHKKYFNLNPISGETGLITRK